MSGYFTWVRQFLGSNPQSNEVVDGARKLVAYNTALAYPVGIVFAAALLGIFLYATRKQTAKA